MNMKNSENKTFGSEKLWRYYFELLNNDAVQEEIKKLRVKHSIPQEGYPVYEKAETHVFPKEWTGDADKLEKDLEKLTQKLNVPIEPNQWPHPFELYIFYNKKITPKWSNGYDLCVLTHPAMYEGDRFAIKSRKMHDKIYPIIIRVHPSASLKDILRFINGNSKKIEHMKKMFGKNIPLIGKIKKTSTRARNDYLLAHLNNPAMKLKREIKEKFGEDMGYEDINVAKYNLRKRNKRSLGL